MRLYLFLALTSLPALAEIGFNADVRPILSDRCFACHGPDSAGRKGDLRLDHREDALSAIVPGKPDESDLINRVTHPDPDEVMPPPEAKLSVSPAEIATLRQWIVEGAKWEKHWAFIPPADSANRSIDDFIRERLRTSPLTPSLPPIPRRSCAASASTLLACRRPLQSSTPSWPSPTLKPPSTAFSPALISANAWP